MTQSARRTREPAARWRTYRLLGPHLHRRTRLVLAEPVAAGNGLNGISFVDATHDGAVGASGVILSTANGGATWTTQRSGTTRDLTAAVFSDDAHGWAVGGKSIILATANGGAARSKQTSGSIVDLCGAAFGDATHVWAMGSSFDIDTGIWDGGVILATSRWRSRPLLHTPRC